MPTVRLKGKGIAFFFQASYIYKEEQTFHATIDSNPLFCVPSNKIWNFLLGNNKCKNLLLISWIFNAEKDEKSSEYTGQLLAYLRQVKPTIKINQLLPQFQKQLGPLMSIGFMIIWLFLCWSLTYCNLLPLSGLDQLCKGHMSEVELKTNKIPLEV